MSAALLTLFAGLLLTLIAGAAGLKILRLARLAKLTPLEQIVFGLALGLGGTALGIALLAALGLLSPAALVVWLVALAAWSWREILACRRILPQAASAFYRWALRLRFGEKLLFLFALALLGLSFLNALTPVWDYDSLAYHLEGARRLLESGRLGVYPDLPQANSPFLIEMLFTIAVALRLEELARLIHFIFSLLLVLATYAAGVRFLPAKKGFLPAVLLVSMPLFGVYSNWAYVDFAWALYAWLCLYGILLWQEDGSGKWLYLAGVLGGLAVGTKTLAAGSIAAVGLLALWGAWKGGLRSNIRPLLGFGALVLLVGGGWYLKNLLLTGNPVYPFLFGGPGWAEQYVERLDSYHFSFGDHSLAGLLAIPYQVYFARETIMTAWPDFINFLFLAALAFPFFKHRWQLNWIAICTLLWLVAWWLGSQQIRFLLPLAPALSLLTAQAFEDIFRQGRLKKVGQAVVSVLVGAFLLGSLLLQWTYFLEGQRFDYLAGRISKEQFLDANLGNHKALQVALAALQPGERIFGVWEGRTYYCGEACIPDSYMYAWTNLALDRPNMRSIAAGLRQMDVRYLLLNRKAVEFMLDHDPTGDHRRAISLFLGPFISACAREIYRDEYSRLWELTCE